MCKFYFGYRRYIHTSQHFAPISSLPRSHVAPNIIIFQYNTSEMTDGLCCSFPQWGGYGKGFEGEKPAAVVLGNRVGEKEPNVLHVIHPVCWECSGSELSPESPTLFHTVVCKKKMKKREKEREEKREKSRRGKERLT